MKLKIYIETSIVSYLTARPSRDLIVAAHQQLTVDWWEHRRSLFDLFISRLVVEEASAGDVAMVQKRLAVLEPLLLLEVNRKAVVLARELIENGPLPEKAAVDALHIAVATFHGVDYLLTWNCKHIANAEMRGAVEGICRNSGYEPPVICTPEELRGG